MINSYFIKKIDGEEVLYLNFDFRFEFASFDKKNTINSIKDFIDKNHIVFKGITILLICGGLVFGKINTRDINSINPDAISIIEKVDNKTSLNNYYDFEKANSSEQPSINIVINSNDSDTEINTNNNENTDTIINTNNNENTDTIINTNNNENIIEISNNVDNVEDNNHSFNNIYVTIKRSNGFVTLELEEYIIGVVAAEMPAEFHIEALKAQAIIARTYTLKAIQSGKQLTDNESTQSYLDNNELMLIWNSKYEYYYNKIKEAVFDTKGIYLTYQGNYIDAVYHSTSNGYTEMSSNVWNNYYPYLVTVESKYDYLNPSFESQKEISYQDLSNILGINVNIDSMVEYDINESGRINYIIIDNVSFKGTEFRQKLSLRSTSIQIKKTNSGFLITTKGYGHGVGMSQYGANGYAKAGYSYSDILYHYYQGVSINN